MSKLRNPFLLIGEGFALGAALFLAMHGFGHTQAQAHPVAAQAPAPSGR